jgi:hypothetical protein
MSSNNVRHLITKTITTLQYLATLHHTSPNYTSLHLSTHHFLSFTLHYPLIWLNPSTFPTIYSRTDVQTIFGGPSSPLSSVMFLLEWSRQGREADHSNVSGFEVKNAWSYFVLSSPVLIYWAESEIWNPPPPPPPLVQSPLHQSSQHWRYILYWFRSICRDMGRT